MTKLILTNGATLQQSGIHSICVSLLSRQYCVCPFSLFIQSALLSETVEKVLMCHQREESLFPEATDRDLLLNMRLVATDTVIRCDRTVCSWHQVTVVTRTHWMKNTLHPLDSPMSWSEIPSWINRSVWLIKDSVYTYRLVNQQVFLTSRRVLVGLPRDIIINLL